MIVSTKDEQSTHVNDQPIVPADQYYDTPMGKLFKRCLIPDEIMTEARTNQIVNDPRQTMSRVSLLTRFAKRF